MSFGPLENCTAVRLYLDRIGAEWRTMFSAVVVERKEGGYERKFSYVRFRRDGSVDAPFGLEPTHQESTEIANEIAQVTFPKQEKLAALANGSLPDLILNAPEENLFLFKDRQGMIEFIQVRVDLEDGDKRYVPMTFWSDGEWRKIEPESGIPLFGLEHMHNGDRVFLHEGVKAARGAQQASKDPSHPFYEFFSTGVHLGWSGGAKHVWKNRFNEISKSPGEVIIVPDNDLDGMAAAPNLSEKFDCPVKLFQVPGNWKRGWDAADRPEQDIDIRDHLHTFDFASEPWFDEEADRWKHRIRDQFCKGFVWVSDAQRFVHKDAPQRMMNRDQVKQWYARLNRGVNLYDALAQNPHCQQVTGLTFLPEHPPGVVHYEGDLLFNMYKDLRVKPKKHEASDLKPFFEFMEFLLPVEEERHEMLRWMATIYARPQTRVGYAVLMHSEKQGVGKSTLMDLMALMIGPRHVSTPSDTDIESDFTGWLTNRRLICVHEIYAGHSWKVYNKLKTLITDSRVTSNIKHQATFDMPMRAHFIAASNSATALRIDNKDRRWFMPEIAEHLMDDYGPIREWLHGDGPAYLADYFLKWDDYIKPNEIAMRTSRKEDMIEQSLTESQVAASHLLSVLEEGECVNCYELHDKINNSGIRKSSYFRLADIKALCEIRGWHLERAEKASMEKSWIWLNEESRHVAHSKHGTPTKTNKACKVTCNQLRMRLGGDDEVM